ncbi:hypothetical protein [Marinobacter changyiensis]|uniref:hypothetical protein n=1 Tax=Marinobacter changyiensis TaxID=2604091 RepID=UPI001263FCC2|nr:hypothetical protein [Marinobacter changyiensis]
MPALIRKQVSLSLQNLSKLREWAHRYDLSESELVRRAIQAYDPERQLPFCISKEQEKAADALLEHIQIELRSALKAVEGTNARVNEALVSLSDPEKRTAIALEVQQEIDENPGFLDEVTYLMAGAEKNSGERS